MATMMPAQADDSAPDDAQESITVCIAAVGDGTYTVQVQEAADADQGEAPSGDDSDGPQTAPDIDSALQMAKQMLGAESTEDAPDDGADGNAKMSESDANSAWKQMAAKKKSAQPM